MALRLCHADGLLSYSFTISLMSLGVVFGFGDKEVRGVGGGTPWACVIPTQVNLSLCYAFEYSVENHACTILVSFVSLRTSLFLSVQVVSTVPAASRCFNFVCLLHLSKAILIVSPTSRMIFFLLLVSSPLN